MTLSNFTDIQMKNSVYFGQFVDFISNIADQSGFENGTNDKSNRTQPYTHSLTLVTTKTKAWNQSEVERKLEKE